MPLNLPGSRYFGLLLLLSICLVAVVSSQSQTRTASIRGSVTDPTGAAVPGVTLTVACDCKSPECKDLTCPECCLALTVTTDDSGQFEIRSLRSGTYSIRATKEGFAESQTSVTIESGQHKTVNVQLSAGGSDVMASLYRPTPSSHAFAKNSQSNEAQIIKEVRRELTTLPYYGVFDWLEFEVRPDGAILLRGQVVRPTTKTDAEDRVKSIEGASRVINEIEILPPSSEDEKLRVALYRAIYNWDSPLFHYATQSQLPIHIIVNHGRATLKGSVDSKDDAKLAYKRARSVPGLSDLKNELWCDCNAPECKDKTCWECCPSLRAR